MEKDLMFFWFRSRRLMIFSLLVLLLFTNGVFIQKTLFVRNATALAMVEDVSEQGCLEFPQEPIKILENHSVFAGNVPICQHVLEQLYTDEDWFRDISEDLSCEMEDCPEIRLNFDLGNRITLIGIDILESPFADIVPLLKVNVYWLYRGKVWVQRLILNDIAHGEDFGSSPIWIVKGYYKKYSSPANAYSVRSCDDNECLRIENSGYKSSGVASQWVEVQEKQILIQGGWIRTDGLARGFIGVNWDKEISNNSDRTYEYTISTWSGTDWQFFSKAFLVPAGASEVQVWLLNFGSEGIVEFQDVFTVVVDQPEMDAIGFVAHDGDWVQISWEEFLASR